MSKYLDSQKHSLSSIRQLLQERTEKDNPRRKLSAEVIKRLHKLNALADKHKCRENVQNPQLYFTKIPLYQLMNINTIKGYNRCVVNIVTS